MIRRIFTTLTVISLLLFAVTITVWIISYFHTVEISHQTSTYTASIKIARGKFEWIWSSWKHLAPDEKTQTDSRFFGTIDLPTIGVEGVYVPKIRDPTHYKGEYAILVFRLWLAALLLAILPFGKLGLLSRRKIRPNHCRICDYDLRATPDRCPECGTLNHNQNAVLP